MPVTTQTYTFTVQSAATGPIGPPPITIVPSHVDWKIAHKDHNGNVLGEVYPLNLQFGLYLNQVDTLTYDIPVDAALADYCEPDIVDAYLYRADDVIIAGPITDTARDPSSGTAVVNIVAADWMHYWEVTMMEYDPNNPDVFYRIGADLASCVSAFLDKTFNDPATQIIWKKNFQLTGSKRNVHVTALDFSTVYDVINQWSQDQLGFDFDITPDQEVRLWYPRKSSKSTYVLQQGSNLIDLREEKKGVLATDTYGTSQNFGNAAYSASRDTKTTYRRKFTTLDFGDVVSQKQLQGIVNSIGTENATAQREFSAHVQPQDGDNFWGLVELGDEIRIVYEYYGIHIDDHFRLVSIEGQISGQGDENLILGFSTQRIGR